MATISDTKYSFIYPIRNRARLLKRGLESLAALDYDKDAFEVVICDYMSEDNIIEVIQSFRGILNMTYLCCDYRRYKYHKVFFQQNCCNPVLAQNLAAKHAVGKHLILTSPEIVHWDQNLKNLDKIQDLDKKFIYGKVLEQHEEDLFKSGRNFSNIVKIQTDQALCDWEKNEGKYHVRKITLYFIGVLPRKVFWKYGGLDEAYMRAIAYDDEDFAYRMEACGDLSLEFDRNIFGIHIAHDRSYQGQEAIRVNEEYIKRKHEEGWKNHLFVNKEIKPADSYVLIEHSRFWRY